MLISCPACAARYRLDSARFAGKRVSIRCPACQFVFVQAPAEPSGAAIPKLIFATANASLAEALSDRCRQGQVDFLACSDGTEAIRLLSNGLPQTLLLDVSLTGRYAFEVIQFVRNQPQGDAVRVLLLTSSFRRRSFIAKTQQLHGANDSIDGDVLAGMSAEEFLGFLTEPADIAGGQNSDAEIATNGSEPTEWDPQQWTQASTLAKVIAADIVLRYQDLLEESARTGVFTRALVEGLAQGRQLFSARMGQEFASNCDFVGAALAACLQGRSSRSENDADE